MDLLEVVIRNFAFGGESYGVTASGKGCFVRGGVPGERVLVEVLQDSKRFFRGRLIEVLEPSSSRIESPCPAFPACPGCSFCHVDYAAELNAKQSSFERFLTRNGLADPAVIQPPVGAPERFFWRNKIKLAVENGRTGYRASDNVSLIPVDRCLLVREEINRAIGTAEVTAEDTALELRHLPDGSVLKLEPANRAEVIRETLPDCGSFLVPAGGFFQTNRRVAALLVKEAVELIARTGAENMLELHCGTGIFSICAAESLPKLHCTGVEIAADSIDCAVRNAAERDLEKRCTFTAAPADKKYRKTQLLLVDPPRTGIDNKLMGRILREPPEWMIYISCSADTLCRDLEKLRTSGAEVCSARLLDMFPATAHFESISLIKFH